MTETPIAAFDHRTVLRGTAFIMTGNILGQVTSLFGLFLVSHFYTPSEVGVWAMFLSVGFMVPLLAGLKYDLAAIIVDSDDDALRLLILSMLIGFTCAVVLGGAAWIYRAFDPFHIPGTWKNLAVYAYPPYIFFNSILNAGTAWAIRKKLFTWMMLTRLGQPLSMLLLQYLLRDVRVLGNGLIIGNIGACMIIALATLSILWRPMRRVFNGENNIFMALKAIAYRERSFPLFSVPYAVIGNFANQTMVIAIGAWYSTTVVGLFNMAYRTLNAPMMLIGSALGQAIMPVLAQARASISSYQNTILGIARLLGWIHIPPLAFIIIYGPQVYSFVFGSKWADAGYYAAFLTMAVFGSALTLWLERIFDILGRQKLHLLVSAILNTGVLLGFISAHFLTHSPVVTIAAWAASVLTYAVIWSCVVFKICGMDLKALLRLCAELAIAAALTIFLSWKAVHLGGFNIEIIAIACLYTAYGVAAWFCLRQDFGRMFAWRHRQQP